LRRHSPPTACKRTVSGSISLPSPGFFSPFPHGTGSLSVAGEYLALEGGPPRFLRGFTCPVVLGYAHQRDQYDFVYGAITRFGGTFQSLRLSPDLVTLRGSPMSAPQPQTRLLGSGLGIQPRTSGHYPAQVPPFGHPRIDACLRLPEAYRSLPRPSSLPGAKASTVCS
jgi:hypothetical protein